MLPPGPPKTKVSTTRAGHLAFTRRRVRLEPGSESRSDAESGSESGPREAEAPRGRREGA
ncbi:hypothetical protein GCM10018952_42070 [Streptosporangium vulgare]